MKKDRVSVVLLVVSHLALFNLLPLAFPGQTYGQGVLLKWSYDPNYQHSAFRTKRKYGPRNQWPFNGQALAVEARSEAVAAHSNTLHPS
ncbi:MAG: hypothetical protein L0241_03300 [Planctomycetia bacterium]|nr:hypothetical protein [Planctomycetia bacterium]